MNKTILTPCGNITGTAQENGVTCFKGIRYARAERWKYPEIVRSWQGDYDATSYGNCCYQARAFCNEAENPGKTFYYNEFRKDESYTYDEDCLFLNIWMPSDATFESKLPVLVYIHGGSFTGGCGHEKHFDGPVWAEKGIIAVTINYRLGPLGFICLPELASESGHTGNYGLYDQLTALEWVKNNITAFGGDGEKITVMGQSAGAMSVQHLSRSEMTEELFRSAVMSSGVGLGSLMISRPEKNYKFWEKVMRSCGAFNLHQFRQVPVQVLFREWKNAKPPMTVTCPVLDGILIKQDAQPRSIPYMVGSTSHDIAPYVLYSMTKKWAAKNDAYLWFFSRMLPGDDKGAWHSSDLWYWFGTLKNCWRPMEERDYTISEEMSDYLCAFVRDGVPSKDGLPQWKKYRKGRKAMCFGDEKTALERPDKKELIKTTLNNKPVGE